MKEKVAGDVVQMILNYTKNDTGGPRLPNRNHFEVSDDGKSITVTTRDAGSLFRARLGFRTGETIKVTDLAARLK